MSIHSRTDRISHLCLLLFTSARPSPLPCQDRRTYASGSRNHDHGNCDRGAHAPDLLSARRPVFSEPPLRALARALLDALVGERVAALRNARLCTETLQEVSVKGVSVSYALLRRDARPGGSVIEHLPGTDADRAFFRVPSGDETVCASGDARLLVRAHEPVERPAGLSAQTTPPPGAVLVRKVVWHLGALFTGDTSRHVSARVEVRMVGVAPVSAAADVEVAAGSWLLSAALAHRSTRVHLLTRARSPRRPGPRTASARRCPRRTFGRTFSRPVAALLPFQTGDFPELFSAQDSCAVAAGRACSVLACAEQREPQHLECKIIFPKLFRATRGTDIRSRRLGSVRNFANGVCKSMGLWLGIAFGQRLRSE